MNLAALLDKPEKKLSLLDKTPSLHNKLKSNEP